MSSTSISPPREAAELEGQSAAAATNSPTEASLICCSSMIIWRRATTSGRYCASSVASGRSTADSSIEALTLASRHRPHVCFASATLGHGEALSLASKIKHLVHPPRALSSPMPSMRTWPERQPSPALTACSGATQILNSTPVSSGRSPAANSTSPTYGQMKCARSWIAQTIAIDRSSRCCWNASRAMKSPERWGSAPARSSGDAKAF